ncbi:adenosylcobinamide-GDP ribazoletransferase [Solibacillus isronensis]|uniref:adenosylcobinamide-GDP ribazoletransferase n=1 Tax=Solibacillus isronensis TaxID=412383 RepID=UPI0009A5CA65|nr:adenosylcobinamide-GDP ribazoletransferase [Solibacillus isronensis]
MKNSWSGFLLAWQFFSAVPIKKQLDMNAKSVTWMYGFLPIVGLLMGSIISSGVFILSRYSDISDLLLAILIVIGMIVLTGGLHLDGWIDMSDAFFSYGEKEKRLEILDDPRTGAFGVISVFCLLVLKIGVIYEMLLFGQLAIVPFLIFIPFIARMGMLLYFVTMQPAKEKGLAAYFKGIVIQNKLAVLIGVQSILAFVFWLYMGVFSLFILVVVMLIAVVIYRNWSKKHFGGVTGDLLGALGEGLEVVLWLTILLCI